MAKYLDETGLQRVVSNTKALIGVQELAVPSTGLRIQGMDDGVYKLTTTNVSIAIYYDGLTNTTNKITIYGNGTAGLLTVTKYGSFTYWRIWAKNYEANNEFEGLFYGSTTANAQTTFGVKKIDTLVNSASSLGSASKPVYVSSGELTEGTNYAGGTAVTLNGTSKSGNTASLYAPTSSGTSGQMLVSGGANASPTWQNIEKIDGIYSIPDNITNIRIYSSTDDGLPRTFETYGFLKAGIYKVYANDQVSKFIYYNGTSTSSGDRITISSEILLYVYDTNGYEGSNMVAKWYYINDTHLSGPFPKLYYGTTTSSAGSYSEKDISKVLTNTTTTSVTSGSSALITSGGVYTALNYQKHFEAVGYLKENNHQYGHVRYDRTGARCGLLTISFYVDENNSSIFDMLNWSRINTLLGLSLKQPTNSSQGGIWTSTNLNTTWAGYGTVCEMTSTSIKVGRYYTTTGSTGSWATSNFYQQTINIYNLYVEEN